MTTTNYQAINEIYKHIQASGALYYMDFGNRLGAAETVISATVTSADAALSFGTVTVLTGNETVSDHENEDLTIETGTGIKFTIAGGTAGEQIVTALATISDGRIEPMDGVLNIGGVEA